MTPALCPVSLFLSDLLSARYGYGYGYGWTDWLSHTVISAVVHALIYSTVFRLLRHVTTGQAVLLVLVLLGGMFVLARARDRQRW